jgi:putative sterol carrier protein
LRSAARHVLAAAREHVGDAAVTAGDGAADWTVEIDRGRAVATHGAPADPTTAVHASLEILRDVVAGTRSGIEAFLAGDLTLRGNVALALELDGLFPGDRADHTRTITRSVVPPGSRRSSSSPGRSTLHRWSWCTASVRRTPRCCPDLGAVS